MIDETHPMADILELRGNSNRDRRVYAEIANQTLSILQSGTYESPDGIEVNITRALESAVSGTQLYTPEVGAQLILTPPEHSHAQHPVVTVTDESTQAAIFRLKLKEGKNDLVVLNFASAKRPGGGFLSGAFSQEETLVRCSGLYPTLVAQPSFYEMHRQNASQLYTDHIIYSPGVPWFRDADYSLLSEPFTASFISSSAPNVGRISAGEKDQIADVLLQRVGKILAVAEANGHRSLLLGAWGCGVFRNDPITVADSFATWLENERFASSFDTITFAIADTSEQQKSYRSFRERFFPNSDVTQ